MVVNIYSITVVYIYLYIVYIIKFYIRTNTITGAIAWAAAADVGGTPAGINKRVPNHKL